MKAFLSRKIVLIALSMFALVGIAGVAYAATQTIVHGDINYFQAETRLNGVTKIGNPDLRLTYAGVVAATGPTGALTNSLIYSVNGVTAATGSLTVVLPAAEKGLIRIVGNQSASTVAMYPYSGDAINAGAADASLSVATGKAYVCSAVSTAAWVCAGN
jgi:hypothetical protein